MALPATLERYQIVADRLLRPPKPRAREAAAAAARQRSGASAWQALAARGLVPPHRLPRSFREVRAEVCSTCRGKGRTSGYSGDPDEWEEDAWTCGHCDSQGKVIASETDGDAPASVADAIALASDPDGLAQAEALAEEAAARVASWGVGGELRLVWRVGGPLPRSLWAVGPEQRLLNVLASSAPSALETPGRKALYGRSMDVGVGAFYASAERHASGDMFFRTEAERGGVVQPQHTWFGRSEPVPPALVGRPFAEVPNPFEPLLEIWALGYVPVHIAPGPLVLLVPAA